MGTQRIRSALFRSNLRDSHFQTGGIATDIFRLQIYSLFHSTMKKMRLCSKKKRHCYPRAKVVVLFISRCGTFRYLLREENKESFFLRFLPEHLVQPLYGFHLLVKPGFIRCLQLTQKSFVHHHLIKRWQRRERTFEFGQ